MEDEQFETEDWHDTEEIGSQLDESNVRSDSIDRDFERERKEAEQLREREREMHHRLITMSRMQAQLEEALTNADRDASAKADRISGLEAELRRRFGLHSEDVDKMTELEVEHKDLVDQHEQLVQRMEVQREIEANRVDQLPGTPLSPERRASSMEDNGEVDSEFDGDGYGATRARSATMSSIGSLDLGSILDDERLAMVEQLEEEVRKLQDTLIDREVEVAELRELHQLSNVPLSVMLKLADAAGGIPDEEEIQMLKRKAAREEAAADEERAHSSSSSSVGGGGAGASTGEVGTDGSRAGAGGVDSPLSVISGSDDEGDADAATEERAVNSLFEELSGLEAAMDDGDALADALRGETPPSNTGADAGLAAGAGAEASAGAGQGALQDHGGEAAKESGGKGKGRETAATGTTTATAKKEQKGQGGGTGAVAIVHGRKRSATISGAAAAAAVVVVDAADKLSPLTKRDGKQAVKWVSKTDQKRLDVMHMVTKGEITPEEARRRIVALAKADAGGGSSGDDVSTASGDDFQSASEGESADEDGGGGGGGGGASAGGGAGSDDDDEFEDARDDGDETRPPSYSAVAPTAKKPSKVNAWGAANALLGRVRGLLLSGSRTIDGLQTELRIGNSKGLQKQLRAVLHELESSGELLVNIKEVDGEMPSVLYYIQPA